MNKAKELFDKILVDGQEINLQALDTNNGVYAAGAQKTLKVDFILKKKDEIPAKIFTGLTSLKSVVVPESVKTIGAQAFANTGAEVSGLEQVETFGEGALIGATVDDDIKGQIPADAFVEKYTAEEAAAYNLTLEGAWQYGKVKVEGVEGVEAVEEVLYTNEEVDAHNAEIEGTVKIGDDTEPRYIDDYNKIEYIYDKTTWDASYANGIMKKYYETYPDEDWYNETAGRPANFNDKAYDVDIYEDEAAIYNFESYNNSSKEVKYGEGKVKVVEMRAGGATVEVIENTATDPNAEEFVGQQFNVATGLATNEPIQLYTLNNEPVDIWVTVELVSEAVTAQASENPTRTGVSFKAGWVADNVQSLTNREANSSEVYYTDMFYSLDDNKHELFTDAACTISANKFAKFNTVSFPECVHCWEGVVSAPGAKLPWVGVWFDEDLQVTMIYQYEGKEDVRPWSADKVFGLKANGHKEWGFASVATEFGDNSFAIVANGGENTFDMSKFHLRLEKLNVTQYDKESANEVNGEIEGAWQYDKVKVEGVEGVEAVEEVLYTNEEVDAHNAEIEGAKKAGDIKPNYIEVEPEIVPSGEGTVDPGNNENQEEQGE